jgi:hypothetical protein
MRWVDIGFLFSRTIIRIRRMCILEKVSDSAVGI